jgi:hypothetical protein
MFCPCGQELHSGVNFCPKCGKPQTAVAQEKASSSGRLKESALPKPTKRPRIKRNWSDFQCPSCGGALAKNHPYCKSCRSYLSEQWEASCPKCLNVFHELNTSCTNCDGPLLAAKHEVSIKSHYGWQFQPTCIRGCGRSSALSCKDDGTIIMPTRIQALVARRPFWLYPIFSIIFAMVYLPIGIFIYVPIRLLLGWLFDDAIISTRDKWANSFGVFLSFFLARPQFKWYRPGQRCTNRDWR